MPEKIEDIQKMINEDPEVNFEFYFKALLDKEIMYITDRLQRLLKAANLYQKKSSIKEDYLKMDA
jgi:hypothetical protein